MGFDLALMQELVHQHGPLVRVVVAEVAGSAPREVGAAMSVWAGGQDGTIGGGALEYEAAARARAMLSTGEIARADRLALGPMLGQCCGGAVVLLSEVWDEARLSAQGGPAVARALPGKTTDMPLAVHRLLARVRAGGETGARLVQGWFVEPIATPKRDVWIWGAGHVGRAIAAILAPLPEIRVTLIDTDVNRFPEVLPAGVVQLVAREPGALVASAPAQAEHLVLTFSHALDLDLCHRILAHGFGALGLIGSATKWARFRARLAALGHSAGAIACIRCPIGDPALGKHPQSIAIGVAAAILTEKKAGAVGLIQWPGDRSGGERVV